MALAGAWHACAAAADGLPAHLSGAWGTAESLYAGTVAQYELLLLADGFGSFTGSSRPATHISGPDKGKPAPDRRVVLGLPLRATFEGDILKVQPFIPAGHVRPRGDRPTAEQLAFTCRYEETKKILRCSGVGPQRMEMVMKRYLDALPAETLEMLGKLQAREAGQG